MYYTLYLSSLYLAQFSGSGTSSGDIFPSSSSGLPSSSSSRDSFPSQSNNFPSSSSGGISSTTGSTRTNRNTRVGTSANEPLCDKYTIALFKDNTDRNQLMLLTALVNRVVIGNTTATANGKAVPGILAKATFNGKEVNMLPKFTGELETTNVNGKPTKKNFLDSGGAEPLAQGKPANSPGSNQALLLNHLYQVFGTLLGCSKQGGNVFPAYQGNPNMAEVHKFMGISKNTMDYFINQVGEAAQSFGVTAQDATFVGSALDKMFNNQCSAPMRLGNGPAEPQGFCFGQDCSKASPSDEKSCPGGKLPDGTVVSSAFKLTTGLLSIAILNFLL